jgi:membrane protease YdiL (CAAX protease family)
MEILQSTITNLVVLVVVPFAFYYGVLRGLKKVRGKEVLQRAGLQLGELRFVWYSAGLALLVVVILLIWSPSPEHYAREGSAFEPFVGTGISGSTILGALLYGVLKTGFAEEFLFRGLIAGSLARKLPLVWANLVQGAIFLLPHLLILAVAPEMWPILPIVFAGSLVVGWIRIKSGSIAGPWIVHAAANVTVALSLALRAAP